VCLSSLHIYVCARTRISEHNFQRLLSFVFFFGILPELVIHMINEAGQKLERFLLLRQSSTHEDPTQGRPGGWIYGTGAI
jgi:hypothetical protein